MDVIKINDSDIDWFLSVFNLQNFIDEIDYLEKTWIKQGQLFITEWFDLTKMTDVEKENMLSIFKDNHVSVTFFPMNNGNDKVLFYNPSDFLEFLSHDEAYSVVPTLIYTSTTILIFEPDLELLIIIYIDKSENVLNFDYYEHQEYLLKIQEMKGKGLI